MAFLFGHCCFCLDTVFDLEQTEISGRKKVAPEVPRDDVIIPIFNTDILKCPVVVTVSTIFVVFFKLSPATKVQNSLGITAVN